MEVKMVACFLLLYEKRTGMGFIGMNFLVGKGAKNWQMKREFWVTVKDALFWK